MEKTITVLSQMDFNALQNKMTRTTHCMSPAFSRHILILALPSQSKMTNTRKSKTPPMHFKELSSHCYIKKLRQCSEDKENEKFVPWREWSDRANTNCAITTAIKPTGKQICLSHHFILPTPKIIENNQTHILFINKNTENKIKLYIIFVWRRRTIS